MRTAKMMDDDLILQSVKNKEFLKMQQTYKGKPFITKMTELASSKSPSIVENNKSRGKNATEKEKELGEFETKFQYTTKYSKDYHASKYKGLQKNNFIPYP